MRKNKIMIRMTLREFIVNRVFRARWIVSGDGEMGIRILGINLWYFKWSDPIVGGEDASYKNWREAKKREFGEVVKSIRMDEE